MDIERKLHPVSRPVLRDMTVFEHKEGKLVQELVLRGQELEWLHRMYSLMLFEAGPYPKYLSTVWPSFRSILVMSPTMSSTLSRRQ